MTEDRVEWMIWNWARWMHAGKSSHLRAKTSSVGKTSSGSTFDEMVETVDKRCAAATDSCVDALRPNDKAAVYAMHLQGRWYLPDPMLAPHYRTAVVEIGRNLDRRGIV